MAHLKTSVYVHVAGDHQLYTAGTDSSDIPADVLEVLVRNPLLFDGDVEVAKADEAPVTAAPAVEAPAKAPRKTSTRKTPAKAKADTEVVAPDTTQE